MDSFANFVNNSSVLFKTSQCPPKIFLLSKHEPTKQIFNRQNGCQEVVQFATSAQSRKNPKMTFMGLFNPLSPGVKLQILLLCFHTFLTEVVGRSC